MKIKYVVTVNGISKFEFHFLRAAKAKAYELIKSGYLNVKIQKI